MSEGMHKTVEEWSRCQPSAVCGGSDAQAQNVMAMALADIQTLGTALTDAKAEELRIHQEKVDHFEARLAAERERDEARAALMQADDAVLSMEAAVQRAGANGVMFMCFKHDTSEAIKAAIARRKGTPRPVRTDALPHEDLCALGRLVGEHMSLHINQPGYRINEWLKRKIAEATPTEKAAPHAP